MGDAQDRKQAVHDPPRKRHDTPVGQAGPGHGLQLPIWDPPSVLRRLGEGVHVRLPTELPELRVGNGSLDVDVRIDHPSIAPLHATIERLDEVLRVRDAGTGSSFEFDPRNERFAPRADIVVNVGEAFALGHVRLMPLDERLANLVPVLERALGDRSYVRVDAALTAIVNARPLCLELPASSTPDLLSAIHANSPRREYPFTLVTQLPGSPETIDAVCTAGACGMIVIDLRGGGQPTGDLLYTLGSRHYHLWPCFLFAPGAGDPRSVAELNAHWL